MVRPDPEGVVAGPLRMAIMANRAARTTPDPYNYGNPDSEAPQAPEF